MTQPKGVFITGTDTGVGKTVFTGALAAAFRNRDVNAGVMKPVQTGAIHTPIGLRAPDAEFLKIVSGVADPLDLICPIRLDLPLAPSIAAELAGFAISIDVILDAYHALCSQHDIVIVEGSGGLCVPIDETFMMGDLALKLDLPIVVVARPSLGTINHTVLTVRYAHAIGLEVLGVVINNFPAEPGVAELTSPAVIEKLAQVPILGIISHDPAVDVDLGNIGRVVEKLEETLLVNKLLTRLGW